MRSNLSTIAILIVTLLWCAPAAAQDESQVQFDQHADLIGRHPEVVADAAASKWLAAQKVSRWHETSEDVDGRYQVVVQGADANHLLAAQLIASDDGTVVERSATIDTTGRPNSRARAEQAAEQYAAESKDARHIRAIRPVVRFANGSITLTWEIELITDDAIEILDFTEDGALSLRTASDQSSEPVRPLADDMASNDVHHLNRLRAEATAWTQGASSVQDKARRIFDNVKRRYRYDGNIRHISEFTWSDTLVRDANGYRGICDEWAVVQITYLRSVGIPARLKFLIWTQNGQGVGHAALEYNDGGTWRHMDALWNAFNNKARYRQSGATGVTVMDADYPSDARSTAPAWGVPDPTGDGKLHPYKDFTISPGYPGNSRPGYSR